MHVYNFLFSIYKKRKKNLGRFSMEVGHSPFAFINLYLKNLKIGIDQFEIILFVKGMPNPKKSPFKKKI